MFQNILNRLLVSKLQILPEASGLRSCRPKYLHFTASNCHCLLGKEETQSPIMHVDLQARNPNNDRRVSFYSMTFKLNTPRNYSNLSKNRHFHLSSNPLRKKAKSKSDEDEDDSLEDRLEDLGPMGKGDKILKVRLSSDRLDIILKTALNMSRNKVEKAFYSDRIRVNGVRPKKKSQIASEGDEIDVIRRYNAKNPAYLDVSRIEILELEDGYSRLEDEDSDDEAKKAAVLKRYKNLTIENYKPPFKGNLDDEELQK